MTGPVTKTCSHCTKSVFVRGMCKAHYQRWWRTGKPESDGFVEYVRTRNGRTQTVRRRLRSTERGWARTPLYKIWNGMKRRCNEPQASNYRWYGGRGITICKAWDDFMVFREWAEKNGYEPGMQLDRKNTDKNYTPANCRWVTRVKNLRNRSTFLSEDLEADVQQVAEALGVTVYSFINTAVAEKLNRFTAGRR